MDLGFYVVTVAVAGASLCLVLGAAAVAGVFQYTKSTVEEIRGGEDVAASLVAGCVAGSLAGFPTRSLLTGAGSCALLAAFSGAVYGIGSLQPEKQTSMQYIDKMKKQNGQ